MNNYDKIMWMNAHPKLHVFFKILFIPIQLALAVVCIPLAIVGRVIDVILDIMEVYL